jgi:NTP pyrophosphatase (non-canonical NTP hydrolase)
MSGKAGAVPMLVLSPLTLNAIQAEATRAHLKHGEHSMLGPQYTAHERLAILAEEAGEVSEEAEVLIAGLLNARLQSAIGRVAHELTYDQRDDRDKLVKELIQVCAMAASWIEYLEGGES